MKKKKNYSLRIFNLLAKRVYKLSKKRKLGWTWRDCQRWTSANLFQLYKGKTISSIKVTEVDSVVVGILDGTRAGAMPTASQKEVCDNVFKIPTSDLEPINWWDLPEAIDLLPNLVNIKLDLSPFIDTEITKKNLLPNLNKVREEFRRTHKNTYGETIIFKTLVRPDRKDDGSNCSYYILVTFENSDSDVDTKGKEKDKFVSEKDLTEQEIAERQARRDKKEEEKKVSKKEIKSRERPQQVEAKPSEEAVSKISTERLREFNIATENLERQFKNKIITRKQYQEMLIKLQRGLERGGQI